MEGFTLLVLLWAWWRCPDCYANSLRTLFTPPSSTLLLAGGVVLGLRFLAAWLLHRSLPDYRAYVDRVHYPDMRARLRTRGLLLVLYLFAGGALEEMLYRGLVQPAFGLMPAALLFGVSHLAPVFKGERRQWPHALGAFLSALLYGGSVLATGSLWPAVLAHAGGNGALALSLWREARRSPQEGTAAGPNTLS